jgi:uncharacterized membrane protein YqgA involved in biofilm formation
MFVGLGTLINVIAIVIGSSIGIGAGARLTKKSLSLITDILGLITLLGAASALIPLWSSSFIDSLPKGSTLLVILGAMLIGGLIGSALSLENRLDKFGETLRQKFKASSDGPFIEGFVSASLLFVIGPLAILGSVSDGMSEGLDQLILKSSLIAGMGSCGFCYPCCYLSRRLDIGRSIFGLSTSALSNRCHDYLWRPNARGHWITPFRN